LTIGGRGVSSWAYVQVVGDWLGRLGPASRSSRLSRFNLFMDWVRRQEGWREATPESLLAFQEVAAGRERNTIVSLVQRWAEERGGTYNTIIQNADAVRSFFLHNDCPLPRLSWNMVGKVTREPVLGRLTVDMVLKIIQAAKIRDRAIFLSIFQGMMDLQRFTDFNKKYGEALANHLRTYRSEKIFRVDFGRGRKKNPNPYFTYLGRDALAAGANTDWLNI